MAEGTPRIPTPQDLLGPWRQMAEQAEQQWNQVFNQAMGTEAFASMMGRYMEGYLAFQQSLARNVERYMQSLNLPTRTDITAIGDGRRAAPDAEEGRGAGGRRRQEARRQGERQRQRLRRLAFGRFTSRARLPTRRRRPAFGEVGDDHPASGHVHAARGLQRPD